MWMSAERGFRDGTDDGADRGCNCDAGIPEALKAGAHHRDPRLVGLGFGLSADLMEELGMCRIRRRVAVAFGMPGQAIRICHGSEGIETIFHPEEPR